MALPSQESFPTLRLTNVHTYDVGRAIGLVAKPGLIIALQGDLGAGKTTFTQGLADGMGIDERVTSPTFTLVNEYGYADAVRLIHIDTYRLGELPADVLLESTTFGLEEMLDLEILTDPEQGAVVVIEWAERVESILPADRLHVQISSSGSDTLRNVVLTASGDFSSVVVRSVQEEFEE